MRGIVVLVVLGLCACGKGSAPAAQPAQVPTTAAVSAVPPQAKATGKPAMIKAAMIPVPEDKQQLARLLAMGYTVHDDHLHAPGVKECPFDMGGGVVQ